MSCGHANSPAHAYCVVCGTSLDRCRCACCGAANDRRHLFCLACGHALRSVAKDEPAPMLPQTYDLDALRLALGDHQPSVKESATRLTQADIKAMLKMQMKGGA